MVIGWGWGRSCVEVIRLRSNSVTPCSDLDEPWINLYRNFFRCLSALHQQPLVLEYRFTFAVSFCWFDLSLRPIAFFGDRWYYSVFAALFFQIWWHTLRSVRNDLCAVIFMCPPSSSLRVFSVVTVTVADKRSLSAGQVVYRRGRLCGWVCICIIVRVSVCVCVNMRVCGSSFLNPATGVATGYGGYQNTEQSHNAKCAILCCLKQCKQCFVCDLHIFLYCSRDLKASAVSNEMNAKALSTVYSDRESLFVRLFTRITRSGFCGTV